MKPARISTGGISMMIIPRFITRARSAFWAAAVRKHITHCAKALEATIGTSAAIRFIAPSCSCSGVSRHENDEPQDYAQHQHRKQRQKQTQVLELQVHEIRDDHRRF